MEAIDVIIERGAVRFKSESRRLIMMGAVRFDGVKIISNFEVEQEPRMVTIGKKEFPKLQSDNPLPSIL